MSLGSLEEAGSASLEQTASWTKLLLWARTAATRVTKCGWRDVHKNCTQIADKKCKRQEVAASSPSSLLVSLYRPVLAESNMEPHGKAERSMAGESLLQHHKVNNRRLDFELRDNNLVTGILVQKLNL